MRQWSVRRGIAVAAVVAAALLGGCGDDDEPVDEFSADLSENDDGVDAGLLDDETGDDLGVTEERDLTGLFTNPSEYLGREVTLSSDVYDPLPEAPHAFWIEEAPGRLLVIAADLTEELRVDDVVQVRGVVERIEEESFADTFGVEWSDVFTPFEGDYAVAASDVQVLDQLGD